MGGAILRKQGNDVQAIVILLFQQNNSSHHRPLMKILGSTGVNDQRAECELITGVYGRRLKGI